MPRIARIVVPDYPHHITQRGNYKQLTFSSDNDYLCYLSLYKEYSEKHDLFTLAFCLMPNHIHFIAVPRNQISLSSTFKLTHMRYSNYYNTSNKRTGHLWQARFFSCVLSHSHLYSAIKYVENNPVRAKLVKKAGDWKWSSAKYHLFNNEENRVNMLNISDYLTINNWSKYLSESTDDKTIDLIRTNTRTGRPSGDAIFNHGIEKIIKY